MSFADAEGIACIDDKMGPALVGIAVLKGFLQIAT